MTTQLPGGYTLISRDCIDSTNVEAARLAHANDPSVSGNSVIWAKQQTGGRGRRGRAWASPVGNLYCSIIVRPPVSLTEAAQTGYVAALAVYDLMAACCDDTASIHTKWPNDVLVNGKKASGILLESNAEPGGSDVDWLIVGIGINIDHFPDDPPYPATSINAERADSTRATTVEDALSQLVAAFDRWYQVWLEQGFSTIRLAWKEKARGIGEDIIVRLEKQELSGIFADIDHQGALILRHEAGDQLITAGDIFFPAS